VRRGSGGTRRPWLVNGAWFRGYQIPQSAVQRGENFGEHAEYGISPTTFDACQQRWRNPSTRCQFPEREVTLFAEILDARADPPSLLLGRRSKMRAIQRIAEDADG
jgi:hypothetical protein